MTQHDLTAIENLCFDMHRNGSADGELHGYGRAYQLLHEQACRFLKRRTFDSTVADDVVNEVLFCVWRGSIMERFRADEGRLGPFILGCVQNGCRTAVQYAGREHRLLKKYGLNFNSSANAAETHPQDKIAGLVHRSLSELKPDDELMVRQLYGIGESATVRDGDANGQPTISRGVRRGVHKRLRSIMESIAPKSEWMSLLA